MGHSGHDKHAGHDPEAFRRKFWLSLILSVPIIATSPMIMDWFGYSLDFPGIELVGPVLGTFVFLYGGWPFLAGGVREVRDRAPGMMLLISTAVTVAFIASLATAFDLFDLDFWWELAALVTIMLLGHWQEMKAIGQAQGALAALAALLPDEAERVGDDGSVETVPASSLRVGDVALVRSGSRVPADGEITDGEAEMDESMITGESRPVPAGSASGSSPEQSPPTRPSASASTRSATTPPWPGSSGSSPRPSPLAAAVRCWPTASRRSCSTWPSPSAHSPSSSGRWSDRSPRAWSAPSRSWSSRARTRSVWPSRWSSRSPRRSRPSRASSSRTGSPSSA
ncbi:hypothetical protein GCM10029992_22410 [Glycomyces albus]